MWEGDYIIQSQLKDLKSETLLLGNREVKNAKSYLVQASSKW